jgi:hypothetical protein
VETQVVGSGGFAGVIAQVLSRRRRRDHRPGARERGRVERVLESRFLGDDEAVVDAGAGEPHHDREQHGRVDDDLARLVARLKSRPRTGQTGDEDRMYYAHLRSAPPA